MVKDYAKYASAQYQPVKKGIPTKGLLGLLVVVVVALVIAFSPWGSLDAVKGETQDLNVAVLTPAATPTTLSPPIIPVTVAEPDQPIFDFYDILSDSDSDDAITPVLAKTITSVVEPAKTEAELAPVENITAPKKVIAIAPKIPAPAVSQKVDVSKAGATPQRYVISLGEYKKHEDAQKHRAALILNGLDVSLATLSSAKHELYRLETGPYANWREAHAAQLTLEQQYQIRGKIVQ